MAKVNSLLAKRLKGKPSSDKMATLAQNSADGRMSGFSGIFRVTELDASSSALLKNILVKYAANDKIAIEDDLKALSSITSEVRAINNQAAILHGERIKRAQTILGRYRDGAFTSWLMATYGNRQTPYNFLQYYEFYRSLPGPLQTKVEAMPRQAVYALASRDGSMKEKKRIVETHQEGQTKQELLALIRKTFPLPEGDQRQRNAFEQTYAAVRRCHNLMREAGKLTRSQRTLLSQWIQEMLEMLD